MARDTETNQVDVQISRRIVGEFEPRRSHAFVVFGEPIHEHGVFADVEECGAVDTVVAEALVRVVVRFDAMDVLIEDSQYLALELARVHDFSSNVKASVFGASQSMAADSNTVKPARFAACMKSDWLMKFRPPGLRRWSRPGNASRIEW